MLRNGIIYSNRASKWLSLLLFLYAMYITPYMLGYANWYSEKLTREILFFVPFMQVLLIGPVVFFYCKSLLNGSFRISKKEIIHFIPAILYFVYSLAIFITDKLVLDDYYFYADGRDKDLANWYQAFGLFSMSFYLVLSLRYYAEYKKLVFNRVSYAESILFRWIRNFMLAFLGILVLRVLFFILNPDWGEFGSQFWHYISFSFVFYYISINGYSHAIKTGILEEKKTEETNVFEDDENQSTTAFTEKSSEIDMDFWKAKLLSLINDQNHYQNPRLTLSQVAKELQTNTKVISSVVNTGFEMNFNDFVNHYRIEAVKEKLARGEHQTTTLLGIAFDCGFNSKATFNRAFKKSTSLSPKDYIEKIS
ncbi:helix-turn-helix domain-containing protein [Spongiivirga citrea]|uniref:helix-turn-helix domain-containing protein n=1 Tax=Spongiivirga citrea TaxID=1481457 RepID=UPI00293B9641|nr:AraC family transcriptional regulator [Spongiivirga citrea]